MKRIKKMFKCLLMLLFICIIGVVGMGYKEYQHALSREPLEEKISSIQAKDNYTPISELSQTCSGGGGGSPVSGAFWD